MPSKNQIKKQKTGFTIIEVVLVLAIAGLIFLMVFVALPALQRSQRDTARRQDYADLLAAVNSYITNHNGSLPSGTLTASEYVNADGKGPTGAPYNVTACKYAAGCPTSYTNDTKATNQREATIYVVTEATCENGTVVSSASKRSFAIYGSLETGTYCQSSN